MSKLTVVLFESCTLWRSDFLSGSDCFGGAVDTGRGKVQDFYDVEDHILLCSRGRMNRRSVIITFLNLYRKNPYICGAFFEW